MGTERALVKRRGERHKVPPAAKHERSMSIGSKPNRLMRSVYDGGAIGLPSKDALEEGAHRHVA
jgi:hypothetical protein